MTKVVEVAAAVLLRETQNGTEFLLAQRPVGKVYSGYWEFPGGKLEPGENFREALVRELQEELDITVDRAWPWLSCEFTYPHARVRLKFFRVTAWHGKIAPLEHSDFSWLKIGELPTIAPILPANTPILRALRLPAIYALTHAAENGVEAELAKLKIALAGGLRLIQIRDKTLKAEERLRLAKGVMALASAHLDIRVLVNDDEALAREVGAHGLHLSSSRLMQLTQRPSFDWVAASCHTVQELSQAVSLSLDFVLLSPVLPTATHPETKKGMGWETFARLIEHYPLPIFALGGMTLDMLETAREKGAHGIAMLRAWA